MKTVSLVVPAYNEESVLDVFFSTVFSILDTIKAYSFRVVLVNDGSRDGTLQKALDWHARDERVIVISLSRNFGHEAALAAGLNNIVGDAAIIMDADLQDPPELIRAMLEKWEEGFDVVNAHRAARREDSFLKRFTANGFYKVINRMSGKVKIPENVGNFRLISRRVVDVLNSLPEKNRVFRVLIPYLGFSSASVEYERPHRAAGKTHYNYSSMIKLAIDGITSATTIPLQYAIKFGFAVSGIGFLYLIIVILQALITRTTVVGWASLMSVILFLGGIQLVFLGILGSYLGRIFTEVKNRPVHIIDKTWKREVDIDD